MRGGGKKILLVKLSSLGDVVHALPVVQDIRRALPDAQVDWVIEKSFAPLLDPLLAGQQLRRVIACEIRRWRKAPLSGATRREWRAFRQTLQAEAYDAVIDLQGLSKSALVAWLARLAPGGRRYALANRTDGSGYEAPTRWVADVAVRIAPHVHAVRRSRELAAQALGYALTLEADFGLQSAVAPARRAGSAIENVADGVHPATVAFVHGTSRPDKEWPLAHWVALGRRLVDAGCRIALAHGTAQELATSQRIAEAIGPQAVVWPMLTLDALAAALAGCEGVIGVDSGVSHIAVALGLPHVQIYNFDTAWRTGPLAPSGPAWRPRQVSVFAAPAPDVDAVWRAWLACRAVAP
ncbi:MAG: Lipopolysaccharide heptosyltransferase [Polaromonas sp.]|nr:Lipopolysaccharide heptosyltransferase [Polaromonas sp.]